MPAPQTDNAIRYVLSQPRKRLVFGCGPDILYDIPRPPNTTDVNNGPTPVRIDVVEVEGYKTFHIDFIITFAVNEVDATNRGQRRTIDNRGKPVNVTVANSPYRVSPLLLHEWSMEHDIDQDFFVTRTVTGRAVFRTDVLTREGLVPDQLRYWLGHPVPERFARQRVWVKALPDNRTVEYTILDRERTIPWDPNQATRVECVYTESINHEGLESFLGRQSWSYRDRQDRLRFDTSWSGGFAASGFVLGLQAAPMLWNGIRNLFPNAGLPAMPGATALAGVPVKNYHIVGRAWGHPGKDLGLLANYVRRFVGTRLVNPLAPPGAILPQRFPGFNPIRGIMLGSEVYEHRADLTGKFVEFSMTMTGSLLRSLAGDIGFANAQPGAFDEAPGRPGPPENRPILAHPMRGVYLGAAVARALRDTETPWTPPTDPPNVLEVNNPRPVGSNNRLNADPQQIWNGDQGQFDLVRNDVAAGVNNNAADAVQAP